MLLAGSLVVAVGAAALANAAPSASIKPQIIAGDVKYNVSSEHKHFFLPTKESLSRRSCASDYNTAALNTASAMQSLYYNTAGYYQGGSGGGSAWTDVVSLILIFRFFVDRT